ncbi:MAG TPA: FtsX-like permease family protein, partial [Longimicrobiales bacterium]|nr:FtsX-like permease family protein [Longimicrobiales bacterium]
VGVVGDTRHYGMDVRPGPALYMPYGQKRWDWASWLNVIARTEGDPTVLAPAFRAAVGEMDPRLVPGRIARMNDLYAETNARRHFATVLLGAFAALGLVMGCVGVYGILSYTVARRSRELGLRMALGASRGRVAAAVVVRGVTLAVAGILGGLVVAWVLSRFMGHLVYGIGAHDPATFTAIPFLLLAVATLAAWVPARRATRVDPVEAMREG